MNSLQIVQRIMELKKVSVQLKQSTQEPKKTDPNLLRGILEMGKSLSTPKRQFDDSPTAFSISNFISTGAKRQNQFANQNQQFEQSHQYGWPQSKEGSNRLNNDQIKMIRIDNENLQKEIGRLQLELHKLEQIQRIEEEQNWRDGLPYYIFHYPEIRAFYTKLTILEKDYSKIDYQKYEVNLSMDRINLTKIYDHSSSPREQRVISLHLPQLIQVQYPSAGSVSNNHNYLTSYSKIKQQEQDGYLLVYHFRHHNKKTSSRLKDISFRKDSIPFNKNIRNGVDKSSPLSMLSGEDEEQQIIETLFIKFEDEDQYQEFDMGVFINFKISQDIQKTIIPISDDKSLKNTVPVENNMSKSIGAQGTLNLNRPQKLKSTNLKERLKKYHSSSLQKEQQQDQVEMFSPKKNKTNINSFLNADHEQLREEEDEGDPSEQITNFMKKFHSNHNDQLPSSHNGLGHNLGMKIHDQQDQEEPIQLLKVKKVQNLNEMFDSPQKNRHNEDDEQVIKKQRSDTSKFKDLQEEDEKKKMAEEERRKKKEDEEKKMKHLQEKEKEKLQIMKKNEYIFSLKTAKQNLIAGYRMVKYAKGALNPHSKFVQMDEDFKQLMWKDEPGDKKYKYILLKEIKEICQGKIGQSILNHIPIDKINKKNRFVTIETSNKDRKTLELSTNDQKLMSQFVKDLRLVWEEKMKMQ